MKAVTANRLGDGAVVYLTPGGGWSLWLDDAVMAADASEADALVAAAQADVDHCVVVAPYAFDVESADNHLRGVSVRERIRAAGPTMRLDLGKQAETR